ncbi:MAG: hypothetical protein CfP315_0738 [Candidatus Improbicoccus pseudotrichonymphae]|uniref:Uncharacterized protein n=1 Tax=Candidatus Improbicoccus pseudotrichonymphae TaxID=3033792 RepID=A0AA48HVJ0_9FIRM|nr:MAG: hypothetical protein CfP315_0738 [Candidatus Improbicoccus pseudotrichonymphae]
MTNNINEQISKIKKIRRPIKKEEIIDYLKEYKAAMKELDESYNKLSDINNQTKNSISNRNNINTTNNNDVKYNYYQIYNETHYPIITGFETNLNDRYFPLNYNNIYSPLFNDANVYKNLSNGKYGNIFIPLSGNNHDDGYDIAGDFEIADRWANNNKLFIGNRPEGYVWHHVFMGWFNNRQRPIGDCASIDNFLSTYRSPNFEQYYNSIYIFDSDQPCYYYDKEIGKVQTLDASRWVSCFNKYNTNYFWKPDLDYALLQLVKKELGPVPTILNNRFLNNY